MFAFNLIITGLLVANYILAKVGNMGIVQFFLLIATVLLLLIKYFIGAYNPEDFDEEEWDSSEDIEQVYYSVVDDYYWSIVLGIIIVINIFALMAELF